MRLLLATALALAVLGAAGGASAEASCTPLLSCGPCDPRVCRIVARLWEQEPLRDGGCPVSAGQCDPDGHCTVNVGYCAANGECTVNVGYCSDSTPVRI
jgi:hypothetical protein